MFKYLNKISYVCCARWERCSTGLLGWLSARFNKWNLGVIQVLPVLVEGRIVGTGTAKPGGGTGDPGDHPRWRFFGGPELDIDAGRKAKTNSKACPPK